MLYEWDRELDEAIQMKQSAGYLVVYCGTGTSAVDRGMHRCGGGVKRGHCRLNKSLPLVVYK